MGDSHTGMYLLVAPAEDRQPKLTLLYTMYSL